MQLHCKVASDLYAMVWIGTLGFLGPHQHIVTLVCCDGEFWP